MERPRTLCWDGARTPGLTEGMPVRTPPPAEAFKPTNFPEPIPSSVSTSATVPLYEAWGGYLQRLLILSATFSKLPILPAPASPSQFLAILIANTSSENIGM